MDYGAEPTSGYRRRDVAKRAQVGGKQKLDPVQAKRVAELVEELIAENKFSTRQAAKAWSIDPASISRARNQEGAVGVSFLIKLRSISQRSIDEILGLEPLQARKTVSAAERRKAIRDAAIVEAKQLGTPQLVIDHVLKHIVINIADEAKCREAWVRAFLRTWSLTSLLPPVSNPAKEWLETHPEPELEKVEEEHDEAGFQAEQRRAVG